MARLTKSVLRIWACSLFLTLAGCSFTLGPVVERRAIIIQSGTGIEILENVKVEGRAVGKDDKEGEDIDTFEQSIGGWFAFHPDHWQSIKNEIKRLKKLAGEE